GSKGSAQAFASTLAKIGLSVRQSAFLSAGKGTGDWGNCFLSAIGALTFCQYFHAPSLGFFCRSSFENFCGQRPVFFPIFFFLGPRRRSSTTSRKASCSDLPSSASCLNTFSPIGWFLIRFSNSPYV